MAGQLDALLRHVHHLVGTPAAGGPTDRELLQRFAARRDEAAFALLLARHGPMVHALCRRLLRQEQDAEDAFQATFLVLARRAASAAWDSSVGGWLYKVACRLAVRAKAAEARRLLTEQEAARKAQLGRPSPESLREVGAVLDEELQRLPLRYRDPLLLCYLEGQARDQVAHGLGCSVRTLARRLERGRELLRGRLAARGLSLSAALLAAALPARVSAAGAGELTTAAAAFATGGAGRASRRAVGLAEGLLKGMAMSKLKVGLALTLLLTLGLVAGGAAGLARPTPAPKGPGAGPSAHPRKAVAEHPLPRSDRRVRVDSAGDPLPVGALARMGTTRLRHVSSHLAFGPDGKTLLSVGQDQTVRVWDVATGKQLWRRTLQAPEFRQNSSWHYCLAANGTTLAGCHPQGENLYLWDTATGKERRHIPVGKGHDPLVALSPDGKVVALAIYDGKKGWPITLWDTATGKERLRLDHGQEGPQQFAFSPDGKFVATGNHGYLWLWNSISGKLIRKVRVRGASGSVIVFPDGKVLAACLFDGSVKFWDVATGKEQPTLRPGRSGVSGLAVSPDGKILAARNDPLSGFQHSVTMWDLGTRKALCHIPGGDRFAFSPNGKILATSDSSAIQLWDVATGKQRQRNDGHKAEVPSVAVSPDGKILASVSWRENTIHLWDTASGRPRAILRGHEGYARLSAFSADGKHLVSGAGDGSVRLWDPAAGTQLRSFPIPVPKEIKGRAHVYEVRLSPDGKRLAALSMVLDDPATHYRQVDLWDRVTGKSLARRPFQGRYYFSCLSPDTRTVAVLREGLVLEDTATGRELMKASGNLASPMAFSPDGKLVAAAVYSPGPLPWAGVAPGTRRARMLGVGVWELATGQRILLVEAGSVGHVAFAPDSRLLVTADLEALRLWDLATGKPVFRRPRHEAFFGQHGAAFVSSLAFLPRGNALATGLLDGTILVWDLQPTTWRRGLAIKDLSAKELERHWSDLASDDATKAHRALETLAAVPAKAVSYLREHLRPTPPEDAAKVARLLADLESEQFATRAAATRELAALGERVMPALRKALEGKPSLEKRKRIEALLDDALRADLGAVRVPAVLRVLRCIRLLERLGTTEARRVLKTLAEGAPAARPTREAREALQRLTRRPPTP